MSQISNLRWVRATLLAGGLAAAIGAAPAAAQVVETELRARAKVFPDVAGATAIKRDLAGRYYVLTSRGTIVQVFDATGNRVAQLPPPSAAPPVKAQGESSAAAATGTGLLYADDFDVTCPAQAGAPCFVYLADRGGNAVRVFNAEGALLGSVSVAAPTSVVGLHDGEFAVATMRAPRLVQVYNASGKLAREFGVQAEIADMPELNRFLNIGRMATDAAGHIYYAFSYFPEPTVRKYDRFGYAAYEVQLATLDFEPTAQAARREISRQDTRSGSRAPILKKVVNAIGVDPEKQDVWMAVGGLLLHFDAEGARRGTFRIFTAEGARIEPTAILVEPERLLVASDTLGVFEFPRPDKIRR